MNPRILKFKTFLGLLAVGSFLIAGAPGLSAHPLDNVTPDDALYQRVQKLGTPGSWTRVTRPFWTRGGS